MEQGTVLQYYRSELNGYLAIFAVNMDLVKMFDFPDSAKSRVIEFYLPYTSQENGFPLPEIYEDLVSDVTDLIDEISHFPEVFYAGHIFTNGNVQLYFYLNNEDQLLKFLEKFPVEKINLQQDPEWSLYFDFLLPTPLEVKINATEDMLSTLKHNGHKLDDLYIIEHSFAFKDEYDMHLFMDTINKYELVPFEIQYTETAVQVTDNSEMKYIVKLTHEIPLDSLDIFNTVEKLEFAANTFAAEYEGWACRGVVLDDRYLN